MATLLVLLLSSPGISGRSTIRSHLGVGSVGKSVSQHVNFPTHIHGHWLDILITRSCKTIQTPTVADGLSDHNTVIADFKVPIAPAVSKHVFYRAIHSINIASFMTDIIPSDLVTHPKEHVEHVSDLYTQYRQILKTLLLKHAPIKSKSVSQKPPAPWMTPEIIQSKWCRRYLEHVWRKSRSSLDRSRYTWQCHLCNRQMSKALLRKYGLRNLCCTKTAMEMHKSDVTQATCSFSTNPCINQVTVNSFYKSL